MKCRSDECRSDEPSAPGAVAGRTPVAGQLNGGTFSFRHSTGAYEKTIYRWTRMTDSDYAKISGLSKGSS